VTRVEARLDAAKVGVVFVAARLRRTLVDRPAIQEPSVRLAGPQSIIVGFVIDNHAAMTPSLMRWTTLARSVEDATRTAEAHARLDQALRRLG
jgi:hypothetical protein